MSTKLIYMALAVVVVLTLAACSRGGGGDVSDLQQIEQQRTDEYIVSLLNETNQLKQGKEDFVLEFRRASDNKRVDVGNVQASLSMPMPGMPTMIGEASVIPTADPGLYDVKSNISMAGSWQLNVKFEDGKQVRFVLSAS
jgi:hypothetical protein